MSKDKNNKKPNVKVEQKQDVKPEQVEQKVTTKSVEQPKNNPNITLDLTPKVPKEELVKETFLSMFSRIPKEKRDVALKHIIDIAKNNDITNEQKIHLIASQLDFCIMVKK